MARFVVLLLVLIAAAVPAAAQQAKSAPGKVVVQRWIAMDKCEAAAHKVFPDYTAEAKAKRETVVQQCLAGQMLPAHQGPATGQ